VVGQLKPEKGLLLVAILLAFLFLVALVPALSVLIGVLIPVPLIFVYIHFGRRPGLVLLALIFVVLFTLMGPRQALYFLLNMRFWRVLWPRPFALGFHLINVLH